MADGILVARLLALLYARTRIRQFGRRVARDDDDLLHGRIRDCRRYRRGVGCRRPALVLVLILAALFLLLCLLLGFVPGQSEILLPDRVPVHYVLYSGRGIEGQLAAQRAEMHHREGHAILRADLTLLNLGQPFCAHLGSRR